MKTVVVFFISAVALAQAAAIDEEKVMELLSECQKETGAKEDLKEMIKEKTIPTSSEGKCMLACVAEKKGFIDKDGKADMKVISEFVEKKFADDADKLEKVANVVAKCTKTDEEVKDKCESVAAFAQCAKENSQFLYA